MTYARDIHPNTCVFAASSSSTQTRSCSYHPLIAMSAGKTRIWAPLLATIDPPQSPEAAETITVEPISLPESCRLVRCWWALSTYELRTNLVPVRGYAKGGDAENLEFFGTAA
jgi:hypothetical protein